MILSAMVSTVPKSMVQFVGMPSWWAVLWMERYSSLDSLPLQILSLTPSTSISAPPPGSESRPESRNLVSVSRMLRPERFPMCLTSTAVRDFRLMWGNSAFMAL